MMTDEQRLKAIEDVENSAAYVANIGDENKAPVSQETIAQVNATADKQDEFDKRAAREKEAQRQRDHNMRQQNHLIKYMKDNYEEVRNNEEFKPNQTYYILEKNEQEGVWRPIRTKCETPKGKTCQLCTDPLDKSLKEKTCTMVDLSEGKTSVWKKKFFANAFKSESASLYVPIPKYEPPKPRWGGKSKSKRKGKGKTKRKGKGKSGKRRRTRRYKKI
jgi:hypothetical protein